MQYTVLRRFASRWTAAEDARLAQRFADVGPAWTVLALGVPSRSPLECRRRVVALAHGGPPAPHSPAHVAYASPDTELHGNRLVRIPKERVLPGPAALTAEAARAGHRVRGLRRAGGWSRAEMVALRQAHEEGGPAWARVSSLLRWRTLAACRAILFRQSAGLLRSELKPTDFIEESGGPAMGSVDQPDGLGSRPETESAGDNDWTKAVAPRVRQWMRPTRPPAPLAKLAIAMQRYAPRGLEPGGSRADGRADELCDEPEGMEEQDDFDSGPKEVRASEADATG